MKLPILSFHFWLTNCPKLKIDLHRRYVAQNLQKCVQILIQFSESKSNQNWGCCGPKTIGQKKSEKMVRKKVGKGQKKMVRILTFFRMAAMPMSYKHSLATRCGHTWLNELQTIALQRHPLDAFIELMRKLSKC